MKAKITGCRKVPGKYSAHFYLIFFKDVEGKSYRTSADPANRNYPGWAALIETSKLRDVWLDGLVLKKVKDETIVDADSCFQLIDSPGTTKEKPKEAKPGPLFSGSNWEKGKAWVKASKEAIDKLKVKV